MRAPNLDSHHDHALGAAVFNPALQNSRGFVARLVARGYATVITLGSVRRGRIYHVHHKPLYEAIGLPDDRHRKPQTVGRMVQRLMILDGVLADRNFDGMLPQTFT